MKRILRFLALFAFVSIFMGCAKATGNKVRNSDMLTLRNVTDISDCTGPAPAGATIVGNWIIKSERFDNTGIAQSSQIETLTVTPSTTSVSMKCADFSGLSGHTVTVSVIAASAIAMNTLQIFESQSQHTSFQSADLTVNCDASITAGNILFSFVGTCLKINSGNTEVLLVPQK